MNDRNLEILVQDINLVARQIGRLERDIKNCPMPLPALQQKLADKYEAYGRLRYELDVHDAKTSNKTVIKIKSLFRRK